jgi:hypothetical protein
MRSVAHKEFDINQFLRFRETLEHKTTPVEIYSLMQLCYEIGVRGHLAILNQPYLTKILNGEKRIESRFSNMKIAPFHQVMKGDVVLLKEAAGAVVAIARVADVLYSNPSLGVQAETLMQTYQQDLALENDFVAAKRNCLYSTLIFLGEVHIVQPLAVIKRDRRAWIVLNDGQERLL